MSEARLFRRAEDVAFRRIGDECLLVPVRSSPDQEMAVFSLNRVAAFIWEALAAPISAAELAQQVVSRFEVASPQALSDVEALLTTLAERQLVHGKAA